MVAAHLPDDEPARLDALRRLDLLDTPPDERFERLVRVASTALGLPMAVVSLVDTDRQWFKARIGIDACETSRDVSFCAHAIVEPSGVFVVPDALADPRFSGNPLVHEGPCIRSYAGHVLRDPAGRAVGALAVADHVPRQFDERELGLLSDLAAMAEAELVAIDREAAAREIARLERSKHALLETFTEGLVLQDTSGAIVEWNTAAQLVLGLSADELGGRTSVDPRWRCVQADGSDWPGETHPAMVALATGEPVRDALMGVHRPNGDLVWMRVNSQPLFDEGVATGVFTAFQDITAEITYEKRTAALADRLSAAIEAGGVGTALLDGEGRITFVNSALANVLDASTVELKGVALASFFQEADPVHRQLDEVRTGVRQTISADVCLAPRDPTAMSSLRGMPATTEARWIRLNLSQLPDLDDGTVMLAQVTDITVRRHLEADLARSEEVARVCLDVLEQGIVFASPTLGVLRMNPAARTLLGYDPDDADPDLFTAEWEVLDERLNRLSPREFPVSRALETGEVVRDQVLWMRRQDGDFIRARISVMPFGWTDEVVVAFTDITPYTRWGDPRPERVYVSTT